MLSWMQNFVKIFLKFDKTLTNFEKRSQLRWRLGGPRAPTTWLADRFRSTLRWSSHSSPKMMNWWIYLSNLMNFSKKFSNFLTKIIEIFLKFWKVKTREEYGICRSHQELSNEYLVTKIGFDTDENELIWVWDRNTVVRVMKCDE